MENSSDEHPFEPERGAEVKRTRRVAPGNSAASLPGRLFPLAPPGARVGLFGGSFDPGHAGHLAVAGLARRACGLDLVVWLVTPGSPLKPDQDYAPLAARVAAARTLTRGRAWLRVTGVELALGTRFTTDTVRAIRSRRPDLRLVWIMGADGLASFHRWRDWRGLAHAVPMLVVSRPGHGAAALRSPAARALGKHRLPLGEAHRLPTASPPAWAYHPGLSRPESSTAIRAARAGVADAPQTGGAGEGPRAGTFRPPS